jgi:acetyl esterase/lipase
MDKRPYPRNFAKKVSRKDGDLAGVPTSHFLSPNPSGRPGLILFFHGGSYLFGSAKTTHCEIMSRLACESEFDVVGPDFRLLPEHRYPAQLEDALAVFEALVGQGTAADRIVVVGDSSGGNLAIELALALRDRGAPQPRALGLISPWCDLTMPANSFTENDPYDFGTREVLAKHARAFAGDYDLADSRISPTYANLAGLCRCLVVVGELELPRDDIFVFHEKLKRAGVPVDLCLASEMPHNPPAFSGLHPEGDSSLRRLASFAQQQLTPVS